MDRTDQVVPGERPHSTARIADHPIHPMLVPFPIVCFIAALVVDVLFAIDPSGTWARLSKWFLAAGLATAALAAAAGLTDYIGDARIRALGAARKHAAANVLAVLIEAANLALRIKNNPFIGAVGVYLSVLVVLVLLYSAWQGGNLVFRHGVGVHGRPHQ